MLTDNYLIEYLIENGYTREEIEDPNFNIDSLRDNFSKPIELSKVTNLEELRLFFAVSSSFLISKEDIELGKAYKISKMLINYKFIGNEPDLKIDKVFISRSACGVKKGDETVFYNKSIYFENIDFSGTEFVIDDMTAQKDFSKAPAKERRAKGYVISLGDEFKNNLDYTIDWYIGRDFPELSFDKCSNIDLGNFNGFFCAINDCDNVGSSEKTDFFRLSIDNCRNMDLSNVTNTSVPIQLANLEELDLVRVSSSCRYHIMNVKRCFASKDVEFIGAVEFDNVEFTGGYGEISFIEVLLSQVSFPEEMKSFIAQTGIVKNSDFNVVKKIDVVKKLVIDNCFNADYYMEDIISRSYNDKNFWLKASNISGYDIRRGLRTLDLRDEKNRDLLESPYKLREVLKDNKYLISILVPENLTDDQKRILKELAPNVNYSYDFEGARSYSNNIMYYDYGFDENSEEHVDFDEFMEAERIFDEIVSGINPSWSELEKFKYLYNELGKKVSYDINVLDEKNEDKDSFNRANLVARNPFSSILSGKGVCAGYSEMYQYACRKAGLTCDIERNNEHAYNLIEYTNDTGERVRSYCDLTFDAVKTKYNSRCPYFGFGAEDEDHRGLKCEEAIKIPDDKVKEIDENIGYEYMVDKYMALAKEAKEIEGIERRVAFLLENMMKVQDISSMSNHEVVKVAWILLANSGIGIGESNITNGFIRKDERADKSVRDILWIKDESSKEGEEKYLYYTFNSSLQSFKSLEPEVVEELLASGMLELYKDQKLPGFEYYISEREYKEIRNRSQDR